MKRLFYLLFGLVLLPALLYAQGSLSLKDINDNLTNNYYNKTASDARYATTTYGYSSAEVDILLAPKADKAYVNATDEAIISDNDSQDVQIEANRVAITLKASQTDMDSAEAAINALNIDDDSQDVTIEANRVGVASLEVGLQMHQNNPTGAHAATAISATWTNVQVSLDSIEAAIQGIVVGSGFALESWVNSTLETNFYTQAQTNSTIEAAIAAIPAPSVNQTITVQAGEDLSAGDVVSLINSGGTMKAYNNPLSVSTSPNGAESVFNSAATTYCSAVALDSSKFVVIYRSGSDIYAIVGTVSGSSISWGSAVAASQNGDTIAACKIDSSTLFVAHYRTSDGYGVCRTVSVSGTVPTWNTTSVFNSAGSYYISCSLVDATHAIICFSDNGGKKGEAIIATLSGTSISGYGTKALFNDGGANDTAYISVSALSSTSAIVAYQDGGNSNYGTAQVLSISGTTITANAETVFYSGDTRRICIDDLSSSAAIVSYNHNATAGYAQILSVSGTTVTANTEYQFNSANSFGTFCRAINPTRALIIYDNNDTSGESKLATIDGTTISYGDASVFNTGNCGDGDFGMCLLSSSKLAIAYQDYTNSSYGTAVVNTWATSSYASVSGISSGACSSGSDAVVLIHGTDDNQSGLITGEEYYVQTDFTLQTTETALDGNYIKMGIAKDSDSLILE